jgi:hypothetical protein
MLAMGRRLGFTVVYYRENIMYLWRFTIEWKDRTEWFYTTPTCGDNAEHVTPTIWSLTRAYPTARINAIMVHVVGAKTFDGIALYPRAQT